MGASATVQMTVNGKAREDTVEPRLLLVHWLRDQLGLTGTHVGCDTTNCGACTVHLDGEAVKSCTVLAVQADGAAVTTIEGMGSSPDDLHPLQEAFWEHHGLQCGYCTPGMIMAAADLLARNPSPSEDEVRHGLEGNLCRCTGYHNIVKAVMAAAEGGAGGRIEEPAVGKPEAGGVGGAGGGDRGTGGGGMSVTNAPPSGGNGWVGQAIKRKEDPPLITGQGRYVDDL